MPKISILGTEFEKTIVKLRMSALEHTYVPPNETHLVAVMGLIHKEVSTSVRQRSVAAKAVKSTDLVNHNVKN